MELFSCLHSGACHISLRVWFFYLFILITCSDLWCSPSKPCPHTQTSSACTLVCSVSARAALKSQHINQQQRPQTDRTHCSWMNSGKLLNTWRLHQSERLSCSRKVASDATLREKNRKRASWVASCSETWCYGVKLDKLISSRHFDDILRVVWRHALFFFCGVKFISPVKLENGCLY